MGRIIQLRVLLCASMGNATSVIEFRDVSYSVNGVQVLAGLNLRVAREERRSYCWGLSGSGKTTTLKLVNRLVNPQLGRNSG